MSVTFSRVKENFFLHLNIFLPVQKKRLLLLHFNNLLAQKPFHLPMVTVSPWHSVSLWPGASCKKTLNRTYLEAYFGSLPLTDGQKQIEAISISNNIRCLLGGCFVRCQLSLIKSRGYRKINKTDALLLPRGNDQ